jgi:protein NRD1
LNPAQLQAVQSVVQANPNITAEQLMQILAAMGVPLPAVAPPQAAAVPAQIAPPPHYGHPGQDQQAYQRERSRSPDYKRRRVTPPGRQSPVYGAYDPNVAKSDSGSRDFNDRRDRGRGGKGGRDNVRKRSPPRERMASPRTLQSAGQNAKPYGRDDSLPNGRIRGRVCSLLKPSYTYTWCSS